VEMNMITSHNIMIMNKGLNFSIRKNLFIILILCCLSACSQTPLEEKRKETMTAIINAIIKNDTLKIYNLVDTVLCFKIQGGDGFRRSIRILHNQISTNTIQPNNMVFVAKAGISNTTDYTVRFNLKKSKYDYIDLIFSFNPTFYKQVYYLETVIKKPDDNKPLIKAPD